MTYDKNIEQIAANVYAIWIQTPTGEDFTKRLAAFVLEQMAGALATGVKEAIPEGHELGLEYLTEDQSAYGYDKITELSNKLAGQLGYIKSKEDE